MVIVKIIGGLGNQMFQYAYAKALQQKGYNVKIDISAFETYTLHGGYGLNKYGIDLEVANKHEINKFGAVGLISKIRNKLKIKNSKIIRETNLLFDKNLLNIQDNKYVDGYFQTEKYFFNIRDKILKQFTLNDEISEYSKKIKGQIDNVKISVSLHIRRGDYLTNVNSNIHGTCDLEYYKKAISILNDKIGEINYFIFSDDIVWVKENLIINQAVYIDSKEKRIPHEDMYLMSLCDHNIIANSTFSWWGAYLNQNSEKIVIAPKRWFANQKMETTAKNIVSESWITL
jgi:hypothetical protein